MSAIKLYGPDGRPLLVGSEDLDDAYAQEVGKRVRQQAITLTYAQDKTRGREKPTPVTYDTLRVISRRNEWVKAIIALRQRQIRKVKWSIELRDADDPSGASKRAAKKIQRLLQRPQLAGSQPNGMHWQHFISLFLEDLLVLDRGVIEKERDGNGWIVALYPGDGATFRPNLDEYGAYQHPDAYVQVVDGIVTARFGMEDLIVSMDNPQTDVQLAGYGISPLEALIVSVTADLHAAKYNASYFEKGAVPEGLLHVGEDVDPETVDAFRLYWANEIQGKPHAFPIMGGSKAPEWLQWRQGNRDMQFMEYQEWILQKMCAVFQVDKKDLGQIEDVNRSTAETTDAASEARGVQPLLELIKNCFDLEIVGEWGQGLGDYLEFAWEQTGDSAENINKKFQPMHDAGVATGKEWRDAHGMGDPEDGVHGAEGLDMHLSTGERKPLPSKEDAATLGAAAQQDREDQQRGEDQDREDDRFHAEQDSRDADRQAQDGPATSTPWKPADGDDPDVKQAMADHDQDSGIGPRNVRKTRRDRQEVAKHDRNPGMTKAEEDLADVFDKATSRLVDGLVRVLGGDE